MRARLAVAGLTLAALLVVGVGCEEEHHDHHSRVYRDHHDNWDRDDYRHHDWDARPSGGRVYPYHRDWDDR